MGEGSGNLLLLRSFQSHAIGKRRMVNNEMPSNDILAWPDICFTKPL
jgi:hypothetical protein